MKKVLILLPFILLSSYTSLLKGNDKYVTNDNGVEPDIKIDSSHFYDHQYLDQLLSN